MTDLYTHVRPWYKPLKRGLMGSCIRHTHTHTHTNRKWMQQWPLCVRCLSCRAGRALLSLSLPLLSLLSLSPSQVNCGHVIKRPSLYPLTLVNEKKRGNKKQFCAANMGEEEKKIDNRERCVRPSPLMSERRHESRTHWKILGGGRGTRGSLGLLFCVCLFIYLFLFILFFTRQNGASDTLLSF